GGHSTHLSEILTMIGQEYRHVARQIRIGRRVLQEIDCDRADGFSSLEIDRNINVVYESLPLPVCGELSAFLAIEQRAVLLRWIRCVPRGLVRDFFADRFVDVFL